ncbi:nicotinamide riboside kinase 1 isoform X3 [Pseudonaja textilis]|uniref:nicotinamide riboside kinase 1 isoform X3 n=1 Tax=Pseudonaja textilis TaxID=8673 RepID=UPI000EAA234F|nr:nicotinamide riboside kinase 1 isoform X3 [Pseudonaja textilis]
MAEKAHFLRLTEEPGCKGTMKTLVIGLGGVTNGGKSTLAGKLKKLFPNCTIISQDDFFKPESEVAKDDHGFLQYDVLDALYMETMVASIRSWMTKPEDSALPRPPNNTHDDQTGAKDIRVLIIEGFLLFNYNNRIYSPPDPPGYFDGHVWPMYQKHRREMEENEASIVYLDGTKPQEDLCSRIYNDIMQELEKTSEQGIIMHA